MVELCVTERKNHEKQTNSVLVLTYKLKLKKSFNQTCLGKCLYRLEIFRIRYTSRCFALVDNRDGPSEFPNRTKSKPPSTFRFCPCDPRATDRRAFFTMQPILRPVELCIHGADIISIAGTDAWRERSVTDA